MVPQRLQVAGRWIGGGVVAALLVAAGAMWNRPGATAATPFTASAAAQPATDAPLVAPVSAVSDDDREARRFRRGDRDKDGAVSRDEYLANRRKAFARLDIDGDGKLSFEESAAKTIVKFTAADADRDGRLAAAEFATTAVKRARTRPVCPPAEDEREA